VEGHRDDNFNPQTQNSTGVGMGEYFDLRVQLAPDTKFHGCGYEFLFQPAGARI
jgi:hypothetical protein